MILALLRLASPGLVPGGVRATPARVDDPSVELSSVGGAADFVVRVGRWLVIHVEFQGYRDALFGRRLIFYNAGLLKRYPRRQVKSVALWTTRPPASDLRNEIRVHSVTLEVTGIVLPDLSAELLLREVKTACFAIGADLHGISVEFVCRRMVEVMVQEQASEAAWRVAGVVAVASGRYKELRDAMEQANVKPPLTDDLVRYGIDVGYRRGRRCGLQRGLQQALLATYAARFGEAPPELAAAVNATRAPETLLAWQAVFSTRTAAAIAVTVLPGRRRSRG